MNKLQKYAKGLDVFFKIVYRISIVAIVISFIAIFFMWYLYLGDPDIAELFRTDLNFGMISFRLADSVTPADNFGFLFLALGSLVGTAEIVVFCMIFHTIRSILAPLKEGTPFHEDIVYDLDKLGWLTIANGIVNNAGKLIISGNLLPGYDLGELFLSDKITRVSTSYSFDLTFLIYAVILFLLACIFRYGGELQQLSDETL